jgi:hypothetical protein
LRAASSAICDPIRALGSVAGAQQTVQGRGRILGSVDAEPFGKSPAVALEQNADGVIAASHRTHPLSSSDSSSPVGTHP